MECIPDLIQMCIARQNVLVADDWRWHWVTLCIIDLCGRFWRLAQELRVVELMPAVFLALEHEAPVSERQFAVSFAGGDGVG